MTNGTLTLEQNSSSVAAAVEEARATTHTVANDRPGTLKLDDQQVAIKVRNLALGGALIEAIPVSVALHAKVNLAIDGLISNLPAVVMRVDDHTALVQFVLDGEQTRLLTDVLSNRRAP